MRIGRHAVDFGALQAIDDGKLNLVLQKHLQRACQDCQDRPNDNKPRKVTVEIGFTPIIEQDGDACDAWMQVKLKSSIPDHQSKPYSVGLQKNGQFVYSPNSLNNVNQETFGYDDDFNGDDR
jgi:hypothetical protein